MRSNARKTTLITAAWFGLFLVACTQQQSSAPPPATQQGPEYASAETRDIIEKMLTAHGGNERWRNSPAVTFQASFEVNFGNDNWVPFLAQTTVDTEHRRAYSTLPNADGSSGQIAYDGEKAWSAGNLQGIARAPARFMAWRDFYLYNIPWMTQDAGVKLGEPGTGTLPMNDEECITVEMTFEDEIGDTPGDHYTLYIDKETSRLRAAEYVMTYSSMMQDGAEASPPSYFVWEETADVDGLIIPAKYTVYWSDDGSVAVRNGEITDWAFDEPFDETRLVMPADATIDQSTP